jgi:hypothetical protein
MWHGFIGQRIAATAKTLHYVGVVLLLAALVFGLAFARTFINVMKGPTQFDEIRLAGITNPAAELHNYATVQSRKTVSTGITSTEKTSSNGVVTSQITTGEYMGTIVGKHILLVKANPGQIATTYTGEIVSLPSDVKKEVFSNMADKDLEAATLPVMLDATGIYGDGLILAYVAIGVLMLSGLWAFIQSKRRTETPESHPLCKALSAYGPLVSVVPQIDGEFGAGNSTLGGATFTLSWVIVCSLGKSLVMRRDEIIWAYKKRTKHSVNFIPTGTSFGMILRDARGKLLELSASEQQVDSYLSSLARQTPWIIFGYDSKLAKHYSKQRQVFAQAVTERKTAMNTARV